jgi:hypothetical protein
MSTLRTLVKTTVLISAFAAFPACTMDGSGVEPVDTNESELVAQRLRPVGRLALADGSVDFLETEEHIIVMVGDFPEGRVPAALDPDADPRTTYERLSGRKPPPELEEAFARSEAVPRRAKSAAADDEGDEHSDGMTPAPLRGGLSVARQPLTAAQFEDKYCPKSSWDFRFCWSSTSGNPYVQRRPWSIYAYAHAPNAGDTFRLRLRIKRISGWDTVQDLQVLPGRVRHVWARNNNWNKLIRVEVKDGEGDRVRFVAYGID